jgi:5-methylcytosine-specific restriction endonuclease McrA
MTRQCKTCQRHLPLASFTPNGNPADRVTQAYRPDCKACRATARRMAYAARSAEKVEADRVAHAASFKRHEHSRRAMATRWAAEHPERIREIRAEASQRFRRADPDRARRLSRDQQRVRRFGRRGVDRLYADVLRGDPCSYCGGPSATIDHIIPINAEGANSWGNLTAACVSCNSSKRTDPLLHYLLRRAERPTEVAEVAE